MNHFFSTNAWTIAGDTMQASDDDNQRRLTQLLRDFPQIEQAYARRLERGSVPITQSTAAILDPATSGHTPPEGSLSGIHPQSPPSDASRPANEAGIQAVTSSGSMRLSEVIKRYETRYNTDQAIARRTVRDRVDLFKKLHAHLATQHSLADPFVHRISSAHVSAFVDEQAARIGKRVGRTGERQAAAPKTTVKKLSDLNSLFEYARAELKATESNPVNGLEKRHKSLNALAHGEGVHYLPFTDQHLSQNRAAMHDVSVRSVWTTSPRRTPR